MEVEEDPDDRQTGFATRCKPPHRVKRSSYTALVIFVLPPFPITSALSFLSFRPSLFSLSRKYTDNKKSGSNLFWRGKQTMNLADDLHNATVSRMPMYMPSVLVSGPDETRDDVLAGVADDPRGIFDLIIIIVCDMWECTHSACMR